MHFIDPHHEIFARDHIADLHRQAAQARLVRAIPRPGLLHQLAQRLHLVRPARPDAEVHIA